MPEQIVLNTDALLAWCVFIAGVGAASVYVFKAVKPLTKPFKAMRKELTELEEHRTICDEKFKNDQQQLKALQSDVKMMLEGQLLIMKHVETGNCTGEVADGRARLEMYLVNR